MIYYIVDQNEKTLKRQEFEGSWTTYSVSGVSIVTEDFLIRLIEDVDSTFDTSDPVKAAQSIADLAGFTFTNSVD